MSLPRPVPASSRPLQAQQLWSSVSPSGVPIGSRIEPSCAQRAAGVQEGPGTWHLSAALTKWTHQQDLTAIWIAVSQAAGVGNATCPCLLHLPADAMTTTFPATAHTT